MFKAVKKKIIDSIKSTNLTTAESKAEQFCKRGNKKLLTLLKVLNIIYGFEFSDNISSIYTSGRKCNFQDKELTLQIS